MVKMISMIHSLPQPLTKKTETGGKNKAGHEKGGLELMNPSNCQ